MLSQRMPKSIILPSRAQALAKYPHAKIVGDLLFISGISSRLPDNSHEGVILHENGFVERNIQAQTRAVIQNIEVILQAAGASLHDLVDVTVFLTDMADYGGMNAVYNEFFDAQNGPARTTVAVHQLPHPNLLVEIKSVAHLGNNEAKK